MKQIRMERDIHILLPDTHGVYEVNLLLRTLTLPKHVGYFQ